MHFPPGGLAFLCASLIGSSGPGADPDNNTGSVHWALALSSHRNSFHWPGWRREAKIDFQQQEFWFNQATLSPEWRTSHDHRLSLGASISCLRGGWKKLLVVQRIHQILLQIEEARSRRHAHMVSLHDGQIPCHHLPKLLVNRWDHQIQQRDGGCCLFSCSSVLQELDLIKKKIHRLSRVLTSVPQIPTHKIDRDCILHLSTAWIIHTGTHLCQIWFPTKTMFFCALDAPTHARDSLLAVQMPGLFVD